MHHPDPSSAWKVGYNIWILIESWFLISKGMPRLRLTIRWLEQKRKTRITSNEGQAISVGASHSDLPKAH
jgi:hypothetical protein